MFVCVCCDHGATLDRPCAAHDAARHRLASCRAAHGARPPPTAPARAGPRSARRGTAPRTPPHPPHPPRTPPAARSPGHRHCMRLSQPSLPGAPITIHVVAHGSYIVFFYHRPGRLERRAPSARRQWAPVGRVLGASLRGASDSVLCLACPRSRIHDDRHTVRLERRRVECRHEQRSAAAAVSSARPPAARHRHHAQHR